MTEENEFMTEYIWARHNENRCVGSRTVQMKTWRNRDHAPGSENVTKPNMLKKNHWFYNQNAEIRNGHVFEWSRFDTISPRFHFRANDLVFF